MIEFAQDELEVDDILKEELEVLWEKLSEIEDIDLL